MRQHLCWTLPILFLALLGCTTDSGDRGVALDPPKPVVHVGEQMTLTARPQEDLAQEPEWDVANLYSGAFLNTRGLRTTYVAPTSAGRYTLILRSVRADGTPIKITYPIRVLPIVLVDPAEPRLALGSTISFTARVKGLPKSTVTWSVEEGDGGSIASDGSYTAPNHPGLYHVVATSTMDPDAIAIASVQVE